MEIYDPVCGSNGITYPNECNLEIAKCSYLYLSDIYVIHPGVCGVGTTTTTKSKIFESLFYNLYLWFLHPIICSNWHFTCSNVLLKNLCKLSSISLQFSKYFLKIKQFFLKGMS